MNEKTLLEKAKEVKTTKRPKFEVTQEHVDLVLAYFNDEVRNGAFMEVMGGLRSNAIFYSGMILKDI